jgi:hypothetical protein
LESFRETVTAAVSDFAEHGYDNQERLEHWMAAIRAAAERDLTPEFDLVQGLKDTFEAVYRRQVEQGSLMRTHAVDRYTLDRIKPKLRDELDRRILASANLIRLNRATAIQDTLQRFSGWATSIPIGGSDVVRRNPVKSDIRKALASLPFRERRVAIDQGHKFAANLSEILATDGGAIAGAWRHHYVRYPRVEHVARAGNIYLVRDSWAHKAGLVKPSEHGYTDEITKPGEEVLCRCAYQWLFSFGRLPSEMLTRKGHEELERVRLQMKAA